MKLPGRNMNSLRDQSGEASPYLEAGLAGTATALILYLAVISGALKNDSDPNKILPCPQGHVADPLPARDVPLALKNLQEAAGKLKTEITEEHETYGGSFVGLNDLEPEYVAAASSVFGTSNGTADLNSGTKVDDKASAFCHGEKDTQVYFSPQAVIAIEALRGAGIEVDPPRTR